MIYVIAPLTLIVIVCLIYTNRKKIHRWLNRRNPLYLDLLDSADRTQKAIAEWQDKIHHYSIMRKVFQPQLDAEPDAAKIKFILNQYKLWEKDAQRNILLETKTLEDCREKMNAMYEAHEAISLFRDKNSFLK